MLVFDFFAGTGSSTQAFKDAGHTVISFELDEKFPATENVDIMDLTAEYLLEKYGQPDFIWPGGEKRLLEEIVGDGPKAS